MTRSVAVALTVILSLIMAACGSDETGAFDMQDVSAYSGDKVTVIDDNTPEFDDRYMNEDSFEDYGKLDDLGRCTYAFANLSTETMPARSEQRGDISEIHPSGWLGGQGWERCHLIAWSLAGENANRRNLITGTHTMNQAMLEYEVATVRYLERTGNHVLYRVTPVFEDDNLIADGVHMEGYSVEDDGDGICFDVYCYNVTPGAYINYETGAVDDGEEDVERTYVLNTNSMRFHYPSCDGVKETSERNKVTYTGKRSKLIAEGYRPCGACEP